jgi:hypothetical protein
MVLFILLVPFLYLVLPLWLVAGLLGLSTLSVLYFTWEPVLGARWAIWLVVLVLLATDLGAAFLLGTGNNAFFMVNNGVLLILIVGIANLWVQSGTKARDVALLATFLTIYDWLTTAHWPLMSDLFTRLAGLPLTPSIAWGSSSSLLGIGVGDLLLAAVFPLVMRKAFSRPAGLSALVLALASIGTLLALPLKGVFPLMVVLGPLIVLQYLYWSKRGGRERTMWQYLQEEPLRQRKQRLNP